MSTLKFNGAFSIGSQRRELFDPRQQYKPGPGSHHHSLSHKPRLPLINFNKTPKKPLFDQILDNPGPGHYKSKSLSKGISHSMRIKS